MIEKKSYSVKHIMVHALCFIVFTSGVCQRKIGPLSPAHTLAKAALNKTTFGTAVCTTAFWNTWQREDVTALGLSMEVWMFFNIWVNMHREILALQPSKHSLRLTWDQKHHSGEICHQRFTGVCTSLLPHPVVHPGTEGHTLSSTWVWCFLSESSTWKVNK